ncbi:unnamed protein product, partial [marine sediment metagenome]
MARSGSYDFTVSRDDIIEGALRLIGFLGEAQSPTSDQLTQCGTALNLMIRAWQARGIALWKNIEIVLFPQADQVKYRLGSTMQSTYGDYACLFTDYWQTTISADEAAAQKTISATSETGVTDGDFIGVETDNGDIHWDLQNGTPAGSGLTLTTGLDYAAAAGNYIYSGFAAIIQRPLEIVQAWRRNSDEADTPIDVISIDEYRRLTTKTNEADPTAIAPEYLLDDMNVYLWPEPYNMKTRIHMVVKYMFEDFDAAANNPDFPVEWHEALKFNLAMRLAPEYGRQIPQEVAMI